MRLYLMRHPKPLVAQGVCYGASDVLCDAEQLELAAKALLQSPPSGLVQEPLAMISSPLQRCERLAHAIDAQQPLWAHGRGYVCDARLAEMDFGAWEMRSWDDIGARELAAWTDDFVAYRCGASGECVGQFVQRVAVRLHESFRSGQSQLWITHAGVIRALQWLATLPFEEFIALAQLPAWQPGCAGALSRLRAADWPKTEVAWCQCQAWDWPHHWPHHSSQDWPQPP